MEFQLRSFLTFFLLNFFFSQLFALDCYTARSEFGTCTEIRTCPPMLEILQKRNLDSETKNYLLHSKCPIAGQSPKDVIICCPLNPSHSSALNRPSQNTNLNVRNHPLLPTDCGEQASDRIVGGELADIDEFPWMVLVEYDTLNGIRTSCSGSIINKRYVVSAAHCFSKQKLPRFFKPTNIRLGEYDTSRERDCISYGEYEVCADPVVTIPIEETIINENYEPLSKAQRNDIALLRLARDVPFSGYIKPVCLPQNGNIEQMLYTSGWGFTEHGTRSNKKLKLTVPFADIDSCKNRYSFSKVELGNGQFCAGGEKGKDSCGGDSGGPIMARPVTDYNERPRWTLIGVVSFGPTPCGREGWPGVYTKVHDFVPWILSNMRA